MKKEENAFLREQVNWLLDANDINRIRLLKVWIKKTEDELYNCLFKIDNLILETTYNWTSKLNCSDLGKVDELYEVKKTIRTILEKKHKKKNI